jgi:hypothetical protein
VVVSSPVESDIGRLCNLDGDTLGQRKGVVRQRQQLERFLGEGFANRDFLFFGTRPIGRDAVTPVLGLTIEIIEIAELARGEEAVAHITDGTLDTPLLVAACHRDRTRLEVIMRGEREHRGMEADRVALTLQHGAAKIVVEQDTGTSVPGGKCRSMAAQKVLDPRAEEEAHEDLARKAQHHDEGHQCPAGTADGEMAEVPPVALTLLGSKGAQAQIGLGGRARTKTGNNMPEVIRTAVVAAFTHHGEQTAGGELRILLQGLEDQRQVRVDLRAALRRIGSGQTGLGQHPGHRAMVHMQLACNGAPTPFLDVMKTQYLRLDFRRDGHSALLVSDRRVYRRRNAMRTRGGQRQPHQWQRHNPRP